MSLLVLFHAADVVTTSAYRDKVLATSGLVGYWMLNETSGTNSNDEVSTRDGTYVNTPTLGQPPLVAGDGALSASFASASSEYVSVPFAAALNPTGAHSIEIWVLPTGGAGAHRAAISSRDLTPQRGYILYIADTNDYEYWLGNGVNAFASIGSTIAVLGDVVHIVATYDGTNARLYQNGVLVAGPTARTYAANTARQLQFGAGQNEAPAAFYWPGGLGHVAIYNVALPAATVADHAQTMLFPPFATRLVFPKTPRRRP